MYSSQRTEAASFTNLSVLSFPKIKTSQTVVQKKSTRRRTASCLLLTVEGARGISWAGRPDRTAGLSSAPWLIGMPQTRAKDKPSSIVVLFG